MTTTVVFLTSASTSPWTVPADVTSVQVECIGPAGNGSAATSSQTGAGGGGGAYVINTSYAVTAGDTIPFSVPAAGSGTPTYFNSSTTIAAAPGANASGTTPGAGGQAADCAGGTAYSGGNAAAGVSGTKIAGSGGGGAAGPNGAGEAASGSTGGAANAGSAYTWNQTSPIASASPGAGGAGGVSESAGSSGADYGGGGGGGGGASTAGSRPGAAGDGAPGLIVLTYASGSTASAAASLATAIDGSHTASAAASLAAASTVSAPLIASLRATSALSAITAFYAPFTLTVSKATGTGTTSVVVDQPPGGWNLGNLLVACVTSNSGSNQSPTTPSGWTPIQTGTLAAAGEFGYGVYVLALEAAAPSSYTFATPGGSGGNAAVVVLEYSSFWTIGAVDVSVSANSGVGTNQTVTWGALSTAAPGELVVLVDFEASAQAVAPPNGYLLEQSVVNNSTNIYVYDGQQISAGSIGTPSMTLGAADYWVAISLALQPPPGAYGTAMLNAAAVAEPFGSLTVRALASTNAVVVLAAASNNPPNANTTLNSSAAVTVTALLLAQTTALLPARAVVTPGFANQAIALASLSAGAVLIINGTHYVTAAPSWASGAAVSVNGTHTVIDTAELFTAAGVVVVNGTDQPFAPHSTQNAAATLTVAGTHTVIDSTELFAGGTGVYAFATSNSLNCAAAALATVSPDSLPTNLIDAVSSAAAVGTTLTVDGSTQWIANAAATVETQITAPGTHVTGLASSVESGGATAGAMIVLAAAVLDRLVPAATLSVTVTQLFAASAKLTSNAAVSAVAGTYNDLGQSDAVVAISVVGVLLDAASSEVSTNTGLSVGGSHLTSGAVKAPAVGVVVVQSMHIASGGQDTFSAAATATAVLTPHFAMTAQLAGSGGFTGIGSHTAFGAAEGDGGVALSGAGNLLAQDSAQVVGTCIATPVIAVLYTSTNAAVVGAGTVYLVGTLLTIAKATAGATTSCSLIGSLYAEVSASAGGTAALSDTATHTPSAKTAITATATLKGTGVQQYATVAVAAGTTAITAYGNHAAAETVVARGSVGVSVTGALIATARASEGVGTFATSNGRLTATGMVRASGVSAASTFGSGLFAATASTGGSVAEFASMSVVWPVSAVFGAAVQSQSVAYQSIFAAAGNAVLGAPGRASMAVLAGHADITIQADHLAWCVVDHTDATTTAKVIATRERNLSCLTRSRPNYRTRPRSTRRSALQRTAAPGAGSGCAMRLSRARASVAAIRLLSCSHTPRRALSRRAGRVSSRA